MAKKTTQLGCKKCPLRGRKVVRPEGNPETALFWVVGQAPGVEEEEKGRPFIGRGTKVLWKELERLGITRRDVYITNICKCFPGRREDGSGDVAPNKPMRDNCVAEFSDEWKKMKGKIVLLLGNVAALQLAGVRIRSSRGNVIQKDGVRFFPTFHPAYISRNKGSIYTWRRDLTLLVKLARRRGRKTKKANYSLCETPSAVNEALGYLKSSGRWVSLDIETTMIDPFKPGAEIVTIALSDGIRTFVIDWQALGETVDRDMRDFLESDVPKVIQNMQFELLWLKVKKGILVRNVVFDTMIAQFLLDESTSTNIGLKQMVWRYLPEYGGYEVDVDHSDISGMDRKQLYLYNATDAFVTAKIAEIQKLQIEDKKLDFLLSGVIIPAAYALSEMEEKGFLVDLEEVKRRQLQLVERIKSLETEILNDATVKRVQDFKINSPHSLRELFFDVMKIQPKRHTDSGLPSADKMLLESLASEGVKVADKIRNYKQIVKLKRTYYDNLVKATTETGDNFIRPRYNICSSRGGRPACGRPNLQNLPYEVREVFISRFPGGKLIEMDFKQIEMRVMAIESGDKHLIEMFQKGEDPHGSVAARVYDVKPEDVTKEMRRRAKTLNFGILYGMSWRTLADRERWSQDFARSFYNRFFRRFPGIKRWQERQRQKRIIRSLFGRFWDLSGYDGEERVKRSYNFPIQSAAVDVTMFTMGAIWELKNEMKLKTAMVAEVHDSIVFDAPPEEVETVIALIKEVVENLPKVFPWMIVPMAVDIEVKDRWGEKI